MLEEYPGQAERTAEIREKFSAEFEFRSGFSRSGFIFLKRNG